MNIGLLKSFFAPKTERFVLEKAFEVNGVLCHVIGAESTDGKWSLFALHHDETMIAERMPEQDVRVQFTNREVMRRSGRHEDFNPLSHVGSVVVDGCSFEVSGLRSHRLGAHEWKGTIALYEFLKSGWAAVGVENIEFEEMFLTRIKLSGDGDSNIKLNPNPKSKLRFVMRSHTVAHLVEKPVTLTIGEDDQDKIWFSDAKTGERLWFQINRVYLMDIHVDLLKNFDDPRMLEHLSPEQISEAKKDMANRLSEICPKGMFFPVVEYECEDDVFLQFYGKAHLDDAPKSGGAAIGIIMGPDKPIGKQGLKLKSGLIHEPVSADIMQFEAELFHYSRMIKVDDIELL
jgi:hypothetical protein